MDIFRVLSRGASLKKSKDIVTDYALPNQPERKNKTKTKQLNKQVNKEIDFFRTNKFNESEDEDEDEEMEEEIEDEEQDIPLSISNEKEAETLRNSYKGNITGNDIPLPIGSFEDLIKRFKLDKQILKNLVEIENFTEPTPIQKEAIPLKLFNRDILACSPTGSGKTLAFLVPLIQKIIESKLKNNSVFIRGLIIAPTRELSQQIFEQCEKLSFKTSIKAQVLTKSLSLKLKNNNDDNSNKLSKKKQFDILITTPLRLIDLIKSLENSKIKSFFDLSRTEHLIFDEADKLFDKNFLKQTDEILSICKNPKLTKSMFSATIPSTIEEISKQIMLDPIRIIIGHKEAANLKIKQELIYCGNEEGKLIAIRQLIQEGKFKPPVIIFLQSIVRAKALYNELLYDKLKVDIIHSDRTQIQRDQIIEDFRKGEIWVLICTDVLSRGIDFKGVNLVINYDVPSNSQAYVHRIGRTGRAGKEGHAITLYTKEDSLIIKPIVNVMNQSGSELHDWLKNNLPKLNRSTKERFRNKEIKRKNIETMPKIDKIKETQRIEMIKASKKRKRLESKNSTE